MSLIKDPDQRRLE